MFSVTPVIINKPDSKKLCPVKIQIIIGRKKAIQSTGVKVLKEQFNKEVINHPHKDDLNAILKNKCYEIEKKLLKAKAADETLTIDSIRKPKQYKVCEYYDQLIKEETSKMAPGTVKRYRYDLTRLKKFDSEITFNQVNPQWLRRYEDYLRKTMEENTVHKCFQSLKKVFNSAIADKVTDNYPFKQYDNPKYRPPIKDFLTEKELMNFWKAIETNPLRPMVELSGYYFLLGAFSSLRLSDWFRFDKRFVQGNKLILRTKKNGGLVIMNMHTRLKKVVKYVLKHGKPVTEQKIREHIKQICVLAGIEKDVSTHTARRSFAILCASKGISMEVCAELMGISMQVVRVYYRMAGFILDKEIKKFG